MAGDRTFGTVGASVTALTSVGRHVKLGYPCLGGPLDGERVHDRGPSSRGWEDRKKRSCVITCRDADGRLGEYRKLKRRGGQTVWQWFPPLLLERSAPEDL